MAFKSIAQLFQGERSAPSAGDVGYVVEGFLRKALSSDAITCRGQEHASGIRLRVHAGSTALAEGVFIREREVREFVFATFHMKVGRIRVVV